ncbi:MAG: hypothetical protein FWE55_03735 [Synergistaceae bacterium]|nr:hypothetical protein [Synergistaceae bacterium]
MIINIHGLGSSGGNSKYEWLKENAAGHEIWSPTIRYEGMNAHDVLSHISDNIPNGRTGVCIIGSSLGGFFARIINQMFQDVTAILINPALAPFIALRGVVDCQGYLEIAARYLYSDDTNWRNLHVIAGDSDELIDHEQITVKMLPPGFDAFHWIRGGTHQMPVSSPEISAILRDILAV